MLKTQLYHLGNKLDLNILLMHLNIFKQKTVLICDISQYCFYCISITAFFHSLFFYICKINIFYMYFSLCNLAV